MRKDYYDILGVPRTASDVEIKRAFRRRARELHPDVNPSPDATARFQELNAAYEVLNDPVRRSVYDRMPIRGVPRPRSYEPSTAASRTGTTYRRYAEARPAPPVRPAPRTSVPIAVLVRLILTSGFFWVGATILIGAIISYCGQVYFINTGIWFFLILASPVLLVLSVADALGRAVGAPPAEIWRIVGIIVMLVLSFAVIPFGPPMLVLHYANDHQIEWLSNLSSIWLFVMVMGGEVAMGIALVYTFVRLWKRLARTRSGTVPAGR